MVDIYNHDCISGAHVLSNESIDLMICDPPFGINETKFDQHYNRQEDNVIGGYEEAPSNYDQWTYDWMTQAKRVLKPGGSFFIIIGHTSLIYVLNAAQSLGFELVNHLIWKYNFGVYTTTKFVTSHYHVLFYKKPGANRTFNLCCRYSKEEQDSDGSKLLYKDLEDVFHINREYQPNQKKNKNKLPDALIEKLILYTSRQDDKVCDFFLGNFTTALVAKQLGRIPVGFEKNKEAYDIGMERLRDVEYGERLEELPAIEDTSPRRQGKPITDEENGHICRLYADQREKGKSKKDAIRIVCEHFERGPFSISNIIKRNQKKINDMIKKQEVDIFEGSD